MNERPVIVIGAGLAGVGCARVLARAGVAPLVLEASDDVGGRVRTDLVEGFRLDRGFQILLTAYPECRAALDYGALRLRPFYAGALVRVEGNFHRLADPYRHPWHGLLGALAPIGTLSDRLAVARLRREVRSGSLEDLARRPETTTLHALRDHGFSEEMIDRFFRPLIGGVTLDRDLSVSRRVFDFIFRMLSLGDNALPAEGMGALPRQIASGLPEGAIRLGTRVRSIEDDAVTLDGGETIGARAVVVATEGPEAARLTGAFPAPDGRAQTVLYYDAPSAPLPGPYLVLDGDGRGPITNLAVPSLVARDYAPPGRHLVAAVVLGDPPESDESLDGAAHAQLREWFGTRVDDWRRLRVYRIRHALPFRSPPFVERNDDAPRVRTGLFVCGDHRQIPSLHGALLSGRRAAEAVLEDLGA